MGGLESHYGVNATLDEPVKSLITDFLVKNSAFSFWKDEVPPNNRITQSSWFMHKHGRIDPQVWTRDTVHSASNCGACHPDAEDGKFDDETVKIPK